MARSRAKAGGTTTPTGEPNTEMQESVQAPTVHASSERHYSIVGDVWRGAVLGDFAHGLRIPGAATQILIGFIPVVGTICAARDYVADRRSDDNIGALLNLLGLIPVAGGFPHTAEIIHRVSLVYEVTEHGRHIIGQPHAAGNEPHQPSHPRVSTSTQTKNELAVYSLILAIMTPFLVPLAGIGLLIPIPTIIMGHVAVSRGKRMLKHRGNLLFARIALVLGYFFLALFAAGAYVLLFVAPFGPLHH